MDLVGTVEAPLMIGKATRNLLPFPYVKANGSISHGVTMVYTKEGTVSLDGTISGDIQPGFALYENVENLFNGVINTLYSKYDTTIKGDLHSFFQIFKKNDGSWVTNVETLSKNDYDWTNYKCNYVVQYHKTSGDVHGTVSNIRIVTNADDPFVPYSGYDIKTYGKNILAYPYAQKTTNNNGLTFTVLKEGMIKIEGTTKKSFLAFIISTDECNAFLLRMLKAGHDLKIIAKKSVTNVEAYIQVFTNTNVYVKNFSDILKHDAYDWSEHHVIIAMQHNNPASNVNATISDIMVTLDDSDTTVFAPYQSSTMKITQATEFPNFDLKAFDGATHIISPGNVQSFHADAPNGKYLLESIKKSAESGGVSYGATKPTNPKPGDLWVNPNETDVLYVYTGKYWYVTNELYIGENGSFPSSPYVGQLVYNPNSKMMHVYIPYGGSFGGPGWYPVGSDDPGGYHYGASAPSNTKLLWIDTSGVAKFYNGSAWVPLAATWG